ncbi:unnamed protein product [Brachionus calyciflorus]|uniref:Uncharacterized protein n=1 Tax=Brachionus calyciflorus TaxID=104777 RepID=A0A813YYX1_9BILA|nr:unnamed protein product [Brachionus calyciflorus]
MKLFRDSNECAKSELDLFMTPSTNTSIVSGGWFEINPTSSFDTIGSKGDANFEANSAYVKRNKILNDGNGKIELIGRLHCDIFNPDRYLIKNVSMNLKLIPTRPEFCLMGDKTKSYYISVNQATLLIRKAQINPSLMLGHALALEKTTANYPIKRAVVKQHSISKGISS